MLRNYANIAVNSIEHYCLHRNSSLPWYRPYTGGEGRHAGLLARSTKELSVANPEKSFFKRMVPGRKSSTIE